MGKNRNQKKQPIVPLWKDKYFLALIGALGAAALLVIWSYVSPLLNQPKQVATVEDLTAEGYVYIVAGQEGRWVELPEGDDLVINVGLGEQSNTIHLTKDGAYMEASTCQDQDCIAQGKITLGSGGKPAIVCLENEVGVALYTREEMEAMMSQEDAAE